MSHITPQQMTRTENATLTELAFFEGQARQALRTTARLDQLYGPRHVPSTNADGIELYALAESLDDFDTLRFWLREARRLYPGHEGDWQTAEMALHTLGSAPLHTPGPQAVAREAVLHLGFLALARIAIETGIERAHHESEQFVDSLITHVHGKGDAS